MAVGKFLKTMKTTFNRAKMPDFFVAFNVVFCTDKTYRLHIFDNGEKKLYNVLKLAGKIKILKNRSI